MGEIMSKGSVQYLNPPGLPKPRGFTQIVVVQGPVKTVYVGGQDAVNEAGEIVGKGDVRAQAAQVLKNLETALAAAGARLENVIKWNVYAVQGHPLQPGFEVFQRAWGNRPNPPAISVLCVAGLAHPDFLLEMDAVAVLPE